MSGSFFTTLLAIAAAVVGVVALTALLAFGFWASRRADLRSLPWLGIYLLFSSRPLLLLNSFLLRRLMNDQKIWNAAGLSGMFMLMLGAQHLLIAVATLLLAILVMADVVFLMSSAGVALDNAAVRGLLLARKYSFGIGMAAAFLALWSHLLMLSYSL